MAEEIKNQFLDKAGLKSLWRQISKNFDQVYVYEPWNGGEDELSPEQATEMLNALSGAIAQNKVIIVASVGGYVPAVKATFDEEGTAIIEYIEADNRNELVRYTHTNASVNKDVVNLLNANNVLQQSSAFALEYVPAGSEANITVPTLFLKVNGERKGGIDATPFIVDGMLDDTDVLTVTESDTDLINAGFEVGAKLIKFIWKGVTDAGGKPKVDYIRVSDIAVDPETDNTVVSDNIIIAGGPLADEVKSVFASYKDSDGNVVIPEGMTIQEVLTLLVCKEMWPTSISTSDASLTSTIVKPTITMDTTTVEVGTNVPYSVSNGKSGYTATPHKASGFTYGWSAADDNSKDGSDTSKSATFGTVSVKSDVSDLSVIAPDGNKNESGTSAAGSAVIEGTIVAEEGTNTVKATGTSATYEGTCGALPEYFGVSNTGKTHDATGKTYKSSAKDSKLCESQVKTSSQETKSFTAQYKWFMGCSDATLPSEMDSAKVRALSKNGWITKDSTTTIVSASSSWESDGRSIIIACPEKYKLATVTDSFGVDHKPVFSDRTKVSVATGTVNTNYKVYMLVTGTKMKLKDITLSKASNVDEY